MEVSMVEIQPIRVEVEREDDGRILASVPDLPGVMAYGSTEDEAIRKVKSCRIMLTVVLEISILTGANASPMKR
jgi:predicted RNase H-like HicB family nuclease